MHFVRGVRARKCERECQFYHSFIARENHPNSNTGTKKSGNVKQRLERRYNKTWCEHVRTRFPKFQCCNVFSIHEIVVASEYYLNQLSKLQEEEEEEVPFEKTLIGMVESQLRYSLRCCLNDEEEYEEEEEVIEMENTTTITPTKKNGGTISMISKSGSMFYNEDDLAAVVSRALYIVETKRNTKMKGTPKRNEQKLGGYKGNKRK